jgi:Plasmid replication region DNA-binding N-term
MARSGLTKAQVRAVRDELVAAGRYPSADAVRQALGDTGSKSTIHKYLKELAAEGPAEATARGTTEQALQALVAQLADRLHADAARRAQLLVAERDEALRRKDAELAELRDTVAALGARLEALEGKVPPGPVPAAPREPAIQRDGRIAGFGNFGGLLSDSRCNQRDSSPFGILLAGGRSDVLDTAAVWPPVAPPR